MIEIRSITTADTVLYQYMEELLQSSFPKEEYRELDELRNYTDHKQKFVNNIIIDDNIPVGLLTYWDMGDFLYLEHFAIEPTKRSVGYGKKTMELFCSCNNKAIVLEVEKPEEEMAIRRIGFYERLGYALWDNEYEQPPYRKGEDFLPMNIMAYGNIDKGKDFEKVKEIIYKEVYNQ